MFKGTLKKLLMIALMTTIVIGGVVIGSKEVKARELEETKPGEHGNCGAVNGDVMSGDHGMLYGGRYYIYEEIYYSFNNGVLTIDGRSDTALTRGQHRYIMIWAGYFEGCTNIEKVVINVDGIRFGKNTFKGCTNLTSVIMPKVIDGFHTSTFEGCTNLKSVIFPDECHSMDQGFSSYFFKDCTSLTSIELPSNCNQINSGAFEGCSSLETVVFEEIVNYRGANLPMYSTPFNGCSKLTTIVMKNKNSELSNDESITFIEKIIEYASDENANPEFSTIIIPTEYIKTIKDFYIEEGKDIKIGAFTVTFDENGHGTAPEKIENIFCYDTISAPEEPTASGCTFEGWYTEAECENQWDFDNDNVDSDITLYAKWTEHHGPVSEWSKMSDGHWHECVVEGCTEIFDEEAHYYPTDDTCSVCGYDRNHVHRWDESNWTNDNSSHWHACSGCSEKKDMASHTWNKGVVTKEPTVDEEGIKTYTCTVCNETKTKPIDKKEPEINEPEINEPDINEPQDNDKSDEESDEKIVPKGPSKSIYDEKMDALIKEIELASDEAKKTGTIKTIYLKDITSLSLSAMKTLKNNPNVILDMTYTYNGINFHVVIPGGLLVYTNESIPWYGPVWLYTYYGQGALTNASGSTSNVYVVQSGDTLRKIAAKLSVSLDYLIKKNPQIKNVDKLSIGDKVNY